MEIDLADADAQHRARRLAELLYGSQQFRRRRQRAGAADAQRLVDAGNEEDQLHEAAPLDDVAETVDPVVAGAVGHQQPVRPLSLIHISEPTRRTPISYAVFCLKK